MFLYQQSDYNPGAENLNSKSYEHVQQSCPYPPKGKQIH